jgi:hypothetical protein
LGRALIRCGELIRHRWLLGYTTQAAFSTAACSPILSARLSPASPIATWRPNTISARRARRFGSDRLLTRALAAIAATALGRRYA